MYISYYFLCMENKSSESFTNKDVVLFNSEGKESFRLNALIALIICIVIPIFSMIFVALVFTEYMSFEVQNKKQDNA